MSPSLLSIPWEQLWWLGGQDRLEKFLATLGSRGGTVRKEPFIICAGEGQAQPCCWRGVTAGISVGSSRGHQPGLGAAPVHPQESDLPQDLGGSWTTALPQLPGQPITHVCTELPVCTARGGPSVDVLCAGQDGQALQSTRHPSPASSRAWSPAPGGMAGLALPARLHPRTAPGPAPVWDHRSWAGYLQRWDLCRGSAQPSTSPHSLTP